MGSTVSIIQQFLHPPVGLQTRELIAGGPFTGLQAFTRVRGPINVDAFGIRWLITSFPPGYGVTPAAGDNLFDRQVIEIAITHKLFDGSLVVTEQSGFRRAAGSFLFNESFPWIVDVELAPGVAADFWWLLVL